RADRLRELAAELVSAGMGPESVRVALRIAAEAPTARDFEDAARAARESAKGARKGATAPQRPVTFRELGELWTSGELARQYPDHVRAKRSAEADKIRFGILNKTIGDVRIDRFTLEDAKRAMAALPSD